MKFFRLNIVVIPLFFALSQKVNAQAIPPGANTGGSAWDPQSFMCTTGGGTQGVETALGCIPTEPGALVSGFLKGGMGLAGGIAFLLILFGGVQIMTSAGNPERLAGGKELIGAAIIGLLLIIMSVFLLRIIGVDIMGIPHLS